MNDSGFQLTECNRNKSLAQLSNFILFFFCATIVNNNNSNFLLFFSKNMLSFLVKTALTHFQTLAVVQIQMNLSPIAKCRWVDRILIHRLIFDLTVFVFVGKSSSSVFNWLAKTNEFDQNCFGYCNVTHDEMFHVLNSSQIKQRCSSSRRLYLRDICIFRRWSNVVKLSKTSLRFSSLEFSNVTSVNCCSLLCDDLLCGRYHHLQLLIESFIFKQT